jgi:uncharacterized phage protein gp47/JayE
MAFQIKDFASIAASQINHARGVTTKITDFQPGSVARTLMEAPAVEVEELYLQMFLGLRDAIPVATFKSFGFDKLPMAVARGFASVSASPAPAQDLAVPVGTAFSAVDGRSYVSTDAVTWPAGQAVFRIPVACTVAGAVGNAAEGVITSSALFGDGYTVSNPAITSGRDEESDAEREARFADFVAALSQGTVEACTYKAAQAAVLDADGNLYEYVTRAGLLEQPGYVTIYLYSSRGVPSAGLIADGQLRIDGKRDPDTGAVINTGARAAGIRFSVEAMSERSVPLSVQVEMLDGLVLTADVEQQLGDIYAAALADVQPGTTLYLGTVMDLLLAADGVRRIVPVTSANIVCGVNEVLVAGALTVAAL